MIKTKELWICVENHKETKLFAVSYILATQKGITMKALKEMYKEYTLRLLIA